MSDLADKTVVVLGGTGNVGSHIVAALLRRGARTVVPSRTQEKLRSLERFLQSRLPASALTRLGLLTGELASQGEANALAERIAGEWGTPAGVIATLGGFQPARSLLTVDASVLRQVLDSYLIANFHAARAFLPLLLQTPGKYIWLNGPLAFQPWKNSAAGLVSVATAGQHMLFSALAQELEESKAELIELVIYAYVRNRETQPGSAIKAEAVGEYVAQLLGDVARRAGESIHFRANDVAGIAAS